MICKTCCSDRSESDFDLSKGEYAGMCYKCVFKKKGGQSLSVLREMLKKVPQGICKTCSKQFVPKCRNYNTNSRYCSESCRVVGRKMSPSRLERKKIPCGWSFSWKAQNFDFKNFKGDHYHHSGVRL